MVPAATFAFADPDISVAASASTVEDARPMISLVEMSPRGPGMVIFE
jgi:hypothetical protein